MAKSRSPNYPAISLVEALARVRRVYEREHRGKMSQEAVAAHLGYNGLNGASLTAISALRKYGLLEGDGRELRVSQDAVTIVVDVPDSKDRQGALRRCALHPPLFQEINDAFEGSVPSEDNLRIYLQKRGFIASAASVAARSFRETMELVTQEGGGYTQSHEALSEGARETVQVTENKEIISTSRSTSAPSLLTLPGEREVLRQEISPGKTVRVLINGPIQLRDFQRLIQILQLQRGWHQADTLSKEALSLLRRINEAGGALSVPPVNHGLSDELAELLREGLVDQTPRTDSAQPIQVDITEAGREKLVKG